MRIITGKEAYLYGTTFALIKEQMQISRKGLQAFQGLSGRWRQARFNSRDKKIISFLEKIIVNKQKQLGSIDSAYQDFIKDLEFIDTDINVWGDIGSDEISYIFELLEYLQGQ
jgi:hypothetical protein